MMLDVRDLFEEYNLLVARADRAFQKVAEDYPQHVRCRLQCSDCCHAVFGIFLIEAVYLKHRFDGLSEEFKREALRRGSVADEALREIEERLQRYSDDPEKQVEALSRERVRCPLLTDEQKCLAYPFRPITCRVYGIPTVMNGRVHVCWKAGFKRGESYPAFNLDAVYRELYHLSRKLLERAGHGDLSKASLLLSVSKSISTPVAQLVRDC